MNRLQEDIVNNLTIAKDKYRCEECKDTGYIFSKQTYSANKCKCLISKQKTILPALYLNKTFKDFEVDGYKNNISNLINLIKNANPYEVKKGFYIQGDVGRGKTLLASCIFNHFINYMNVKFVKVGDLIYKAREIYNGGEFNIDKFKEVDVLILDDFGVEKPTEFAEGIILSIIDYRYERLLPTFITSNIPVNKIIEYYLKHGRRLESRLTGENGMCMVVTLDGKDRRK